MTKQKGNILIVDDDTGVLQTAKFILKQYYTNVIVTRKPEEIPFLVGNTSFDLVLLDMNFKPGVSTGEEGLTWLTEVVFRSPETSVVMITAYGELSLAVEAMKAGAVDFIVKPWENEKFIATITSAFNLSISKREIDKLKSVNQTINKDLAGQNELIGSSVSFKNVIQLADKVAPTDASVLILGENGTGKELVARRIHEHSNRKDQPFVKVDLGAIARTLFESELFGHEKGAFTDAKSMKKGRFELASGGTLFLDEIGNIDITLQSKLLSALQNREISRVGSSTSLSVDIRLICATNLSLEKEVESGNFREDLYYRLNTFEIDLPPLRSRKEDIRLLADHFLDEMIKKYRKDNLRLSRETIKKLEAWHWPGNVRELEHVIERTAILTTGNTILPDDVLLSGTKRKQTSDHDHISLNEMEKQAIHMALIKFGGNMSRVSKELGLGRTTLYRKLKKYGL